MRKFWISRTVKSRTSIAFNPYINKKIREFKIEFKIEPGLIDEVFDFLNIKISHFKKDTDKDCILVLDEMCITSGIFYDNSSKKFIGKVTLPDNNKQEACLVIMLAGIASRWKQIVAYHFTTKTLKVVDLKDIIDNVIKKSQNLDLRIHSITSDMDGANQGLWKLFGINASRFSGVSNYCKHPCDEKKKLWSFGDVPHCFKNIKNGFLNNKYIKVSQTFVAKYNLPTNLVEISHLQQLIETQKDLDFMLAPKLCEEYLNTNNHFS